MPQSIFSLATKQRSFSFEPKIPTKINFITLCVKIVTSDVNLLKVLLQFSWSIWQSLLNKFEQRYCFQNTLGLV